MPNRPPNTECREVKWDALTSSAGEGSCRYKRGAKEHNASSLRLEWLGVLSKLLQMTGASSLWATQMFYLHSSSSTSTIPTSISFFIHLINKQNIWLYLRKPITWWNDWFLHIWMKESSKVKTGWDKDKSSQLQNTKGAKERYRLCRAPGVLLISSHCGRNF